MIDPEVAHAIDSLPNQLNELGFDAWGFQKERAKLWYSVGRRIITPYFRPRVTGIETCRRAAA